MKFLHTRLRVSDMTRSVDFYTKILGLTVSRSTTSPRGYPLIFLRGTDAAEIELVQLPDPFHIPDDLLHIAFAVPDISRFSSILTDGPTTTSSGNIIGFVSDPDGYEIELIQGSDDAEEKKAKNSNSKSKK